MVPAVIDVCGYFGNFQVRESVYTFHWLIVLPAIHDQLTRYTKPDQADHFVEIFLHEIGSVQGRIYSTQARSILLMTITAMLKI